MIFIGRVVPFDTSRSAPLVFHRGKFKEIWHQEDTPTRTDRADVGIVDEFLPFLIGRGQFLLDYLVVQHCRELGMALPQYTLMGPSA